jgi:hypothetical protein
VDRSAFKRGAGGAGMPAGTNWILLNKFFEFRGGIVGNYHPQQLAIEPVNKGPVRSA